MGRIFIQEINSYRYGTSGHAIMSATVYIMTTSSYNINALKSIIQFIMYKNVSFLSLKEWMILNVANKHVSCTSVLSNLLLNHTVSFHWIAPRSTPKLLLSL
jgi:hypothetical protein